MACQWKLQRGISSRSRAPGGAGIQLDPDRAAEQVHVARDRVDRHRRASTTRSQVVTGDATGCAAFLPQRKRRPVGTSAGVVAEPLRLVEHGRGPVAERARLALAAGELDRRGEEHGRRAGFSFAAAGHGREDGARAVGPRPFRRL